jgi:U3 small nucleolar ribonucleoprotein protein IMP3
MERQLLAKLYDMGVLNSQAKLSDVDNKLTVAAFCRRRLAVIMCMSHMAETVSSVSCHPYLNLYLLTILRR